MDTIVQVLLCRPRPSRRSFKSEAWMIVRLAYWMPWSSRIFLIARYLVLGKADVKLLAGMTSQVGWTPPFGGL
jgi:hypothetical protein